MRGRPLMPTSLVGSYAQPNWLIDKDRLGHRLPPRVLLNQLWQVSAEWLAEELEELMKDEKKRKKMKVACKILADKEAASKIAEKLMKPYRT